MKSFLWLAVFVPAFFCSTQAFPFLQEDEISALQEDLISVPLGQRIARWAEEFVGTPYDPDPLGEYVTQKVIVADERVDCMYHTFRSVELALGRTPGEAVEAALDRRFITRGVLRNGVVTNYDERFQYAEDMLMSGKWGKDVTSTVLPSSIVRIEGSRGLSEVHVLPASGIAQALPALKSGDIIYFVKDPGKRLVGEIAGHIGIIKREGNEVFLIHASGRKNKGGEVVKVPFVEYASSMPFVGIMVGRMGR